MHPKLYLYVLAVLTAISSAYAVDRLADTSGPGPAPGLTSGQLAGLVRDINTAGQGSDPANLTEVGGVLFFTATTPETGRELWRSDGTAEGTVLLRDINPGAADSFPNFLTEVGGVLFFRVFAPGVGGELWKSDGTAGGTVLVRDINLGQADSLPSNLTDVGGVVFFNATTPEAGFELWRSDGTAEGTVLVEDINPGAADSFPTGLTDVGGTLFFAAIEPRAGRELWAIVVKIVSPGLSPREAIGQLIDQVEALVVADHLKQGQGEALINKLEMAIKQLDRGHIKQAINQLESFIHRVNRLIDRGELPPAEGQSLIRTANEIIAALERLKGRRVK